MIVVLRGMLAISLFLLLVWGVLNLNSRQKDILVGLLGNLDAISPSPSKPVVA